MITDTLHYFNSGLDKVHCGYDNKLYEHYGLQN